MLSILPSLTVAPVAVAALAAAPVPAAPAAEVHTDRACYADPGQRQDTVAFSGSGLTAGAPYQMTLDGSPLTGGAGNADADGALTGSFAAPSLLATAPRHARQHTYVLGVRDASGSVPLTTTFTVSQLYATFAPSSGDPRSLKVRFKLYGFGLAGTGAPRIYLHYVAPDGRVAHTVRLGTAKGACGALKTARRRLFPFAARRGAWKLQFDTSRRYVRGTSRSPFLFYTVGVTIRDARV